MWNLGVLRCSAVALLLPLCCCLLLTVNVAIIAVAAQPYRGLYYEPRCTDSQTGRELYVGEFFMRPGRCIRVQCLGTLDIWEDSCQVPQLSGNCSRVPAPNEYLDYPKCCPMYECLSFETNENGDRVEARLYDHYGTIHRTNIHQIVIIKEPRDKGQVPVTRFNIP